MSGFKRRWMITGKLKTKTPLHIGSGMTVNRDGLINEKTKRPVEISGIAVDARGKPYLPGSTLKGNIRSWAKENSLMSPAVLENLFGTDDAAAADSVGGKADFFDAPANEPDMSDPNPPHWCHDRLTGVLTSTQINRRTRTVSDKKLFHYEYVPAGVVFDFRIGGQDLEDPPDDTELIQLLAVLEGFNVDEIGLGAETGNGWGLFEWDLKDIRELTAEGIGKWIEDGCIEVGYAALKTVGEERFHSLKQTAKSLIKQKEPNLIELGIELSFDSNFAVNDPFRTGKGEKLPDHTPLRDIDNLVWLPPRSFRGAFRAQAEKILRTIGGGKAACYPDGEGERETCRPVREIGEVKNLCFACQIFGASGWRSPFQVTEFKPESNGDEHQGQFMKQEFVAIDRFTGGGAKSAKFNAESFYRPKLKGKISFDLAALENTPAAEWCLGLLALTVRDLVEGDIHFGFGSSKGYASCTANITSVKSVQWDELPGSIRQMVEGIGMVRENTLEHLTPEVPLEEDTPLGFAIGLFIETLTEKLTANQSGG